MNKGNMMILSIVLLAAAGFCVSLYMYMLELKLKNNPTYKAVCDLSDKVSCTKPILSEYSHLFYISNALLGMIFYAWVGVLGFLDAQWTIVLSVIAGAIGSIILAYYLFFKVHSYCVLCISTYLINALLLLAAFNLPKP